MSDPIRNAKNDDYDAGVHAKVMIRPRVHRKPSTMICTKNRSALKLEWWGRGGNQSRSISQYIRRYSFKFYYTRSFRILRNPRFCDFIFTWNRSRTKKAFKCGKKMIQYFICTIIQQYLTIIIWKIAWILT